MANWPWVVAYIAASAVVFVFLRRRSSTDEQAAQSQHVNDGFGAAKSLSRIAAAFFRLTCPQLLLLLVAAAWVVRLVVGQWNLWDAAVVLGVLAFWPIQEWLIHVFLLHLKPFTLLGRKIDPIISRNHRNHHNNPWDPVLGVTPPHIIWLYVAGIPGLWSLAMPIPQAITGVAVYFCLVLNYEWVHYLIHTSYTPRTWFYKRLWLNHRLHHFKNEQYWYGVTMLSGDRLLGTQPAVAEAARSETCLTLGHVDHEGHPAAVAAGARTSRRQSRPWPTAVRKPRIQLGANDQPAAASPLTEKGDAALFRRKQLRPLFVSFQPRVALPSRFLPPRRHRASSAAACRASIRRRGRAASAGERWRESSRGPSDAGC